MNKELILQTENNLKMNELEKQVRRLNLDEIKNYVTRYNLCIKTSKNLLSKELSKSEPRIDVIKYFINNGVYIDKYSLRNAVKHLEIVKYFVEINSNNYDYLLNKAVEFGQLDSVKYLLSLK